MRRGELWTLRDNNYASKTRPVIIVQADPDDDFDSVILCLFTTFESEDIFTRVRIEPTAEDRLKNVSFVMTEKIVTVEKSILGMHIGDLTSGICVRRLWTKVQRLASIFSRRCWPESFTFPTCRDNVTVYSH